MTEYPFLVYFQTSVQSLIRQTTPSPRTTRRRRPTRPTPRTTTPRVERTTRPPKPTGEQVAQAFTEQQYDKAQIITGQRWDNSHYLENLSGYETHCSMIRTKKWTFPYASAMAMQRGRNIVGMFGFTENNGSTPKALDIILANMQRISSKEVGCSLIPDCFLNNDPQMYVVVSCIFEI